MWIVEKKVGIFTHYLTLSGKFQPGILKDTASHIEKAKHFNSKQMAESMVKVHGGVIRQLDRTD